MANQSKFDILSLPNLVTDHIFSYLGGASLHRARQVCKQWNIYIVERLWKIPYNRRQMTNRMERTWRQGDGDLQAGHGLAGGRGQGRRLPEAQAGY